jgi:hypothetical protein
MSTATDYAFENPVTLLEDATLIRTASQAMEIVRTNLRRRFSMHGLNTVLMLERALGGDEVEEARSAFCEWATQEGLA